MCGIAGIIQSSPDSFAQQKVKKMCDALAHRGPDGEGFWQNEENNAFLGHRRLSIIDLTDTASQPFHYHDRFVIIHNGEIYNYIELREKLSAKGHSFRSQSDTEVITAAYAEWKEECLQHFDGMFAFAIWDRKENELFAARDRFGEKPFYFSFNSQTQVFLFASEMKALWAAGLQRKINLKMLFNFLTIGYVDNPNDPGETFDSQIRKLPPAHFMKIQLAGGLKLTTERYWDIDVEKENRSIRDESAIEEFRDLFQTSVQRRLRSDVPVGTSLSGGLDSSSIVAAISGLQDARLQSFSAIFPGFERNEERHIDEVVKMYSIPSHKSILRDEDIPSLFQKVIHHQDEPFGSAGTLPQFAVFERAAKEGTRVLLDGQGADETLAGYHKYFKWYWQELFIKRKLMRSRELQYAKDNGVNESFGIRNIVAALVPEFASVVLERRYLLNALQHEDLTRDFIHFQSQEAYYTTPSIFSLNGALYFNVCMHGLEELLRYADRNSMANGREVRLPFLSHQLVEFVFSLPAKFKIRQGWTKWILRKSMDQRLPGSITWRKDKVGFEPPQETWMSLPPIREMIVEAKRKLVKEKILKAEVIDKPIRPAAAYDKDNDDWRYLVSAAYLYV